MINYRILCLVLCLFVWNNYSKAQSDLRNWPAHADPEQLGIKIVNRFLASPHDNYNRPKPPDKIKYPEACTWYGALIFSKETKNKDLLKGLVNRFEPFFTNEAQLIPIPNHVDNTVFGAIPLSLYQQTKEAKYLKLGQHFADEQWSVNSGIDSNKYLEQGLSPQTRLWIDDMFMITAVQSQAYLATGETKYINRAALEMVYYLDKLQKPNGLFYHAPNAPFFWGRGNGWMAAGMAKLLTSLPKDNPHRSRIMIGYKKMMEALLINQTQSGMWRQLINDNESWPETSSTGMFTFAMITGVKNGWLVEKKYAVAARKAWLQLISYLDENTAIREVCAGTNAKDDRQYYLDRPRVIGDLHGQAPLLWCITALLKK